MTNEAAVNEMSLIMKQLSLENQQYFLTLARVAAIAEKAAINEHKPKKSIAV